jgi:hypothetical protein
MIPPPSWGGRSILDSVRDVEMTARQYDTPVERAKRPLDGCTTPLLRANIKGQTTRSRLSSCVLPSAQRSVGNCRRPIQARAGRCAPPPPRQSRHSRFEVTPSVASRSTPPSPAPIPTTIVCPCCGGPVARMAKRLLDRLLGPLRGARRRYRCTIVTCGWTSSERVQSEPALLLYRIGPAARDSPSEDSGPRRPGFRR